MKVIIYSVLYLLMAGFFSRAQADEFGSCFREVPPVALEDSFYDVQNIASAAGEDGEVMENLYLDADNERENLYKYFEYDFFIPIWSRD